MTKQILELRSKAETARGMYNLGMITRESAKKEIEPYLKIVNEKSVEIAKKYNQIPKLVSFVDFIR